MDSLNWLLPLLLLWPALWLLRVVLVTRAILGLRERLVRMEPRPRAEIPGYMAAAAAPLEAFLTDAGFVYRQVLYSPATAGPGFESWAPEWIEESQTISATLIPLQSVERSGEMCLAFGTTMADGTEVVTTDWDDESLAPFGPSVEVEVRAEEEPGGLLERHIKRVEQAATARGTQPAALDAAQAVERGHTLGRERWEHLVATGAVAERADGTLGWRLGAAARMAVLALRRAKRNQVRLAKHPPASVARRVELSPEQRTEIELRHLRQMETLRRGRLSGRVKALVMVGSLVLFVVALGLTLSWSTAIIVTAVLVFHECGHLLGMWIFGHRDTQLLFLPFLGGAAVSHDEKPLKPWQSLTMIFMGPLPGLFLGIVVLAMPDPGLEWWTELGFVLIGLNVFNLLPILPLDGGQVFEISVAHRFPRLRLMFLGASGVGLLVLAWVLGQAVLLGAIGVIMLLRLPTEARLASTLRRLRREGPDPRTAGEALDRAILEQMRQPAWSKVSIGQRLQKVVQLRRSLQTEPGGWGSFFLAGLMFLSPLWLGLPLYVGVAHWGEADEVAEALARAEAEGLFVDADLPPVPVAEEDNGAIPMRDALEAFNRGELSDPVVIDDLLAKLREAIARPAFEPATVFALPTLETWRIPMVFRFVISQAGTLRRSGDSRGALDRLELGLALHNRVRDSVRWFNFSLDLNSGEELWKEVEETLVGDPGAADLEQLRRLAALADDQGVREKLGSAFLLNQVEMVRASLNLTGGAFGSGEESRNMVSLLVWIVGKVMGGDAHVAQSIDAVVASKADVERLVDGHWPEAEVPTEHADFVNWNRMRLRRAGDYIARLRLAQAALAFYWRRQTNDPAPWDVADPTHPVTGQQIEHREQGRFVVLALRSQNVRRPKASTVLASNGDVTELTWRLAP